MNDLKYLFKVAVQLLVLLCLLSTSIHVMVIVVAQPSKCPSPSDTVCVSMCDSKNSTFVVAYDKSHMHLVNAQYGELISSVKLPSDLISFSGNIKYDASSGRIYFLGNGMLYELTILSSTLITSKILNQIALPTDSIIDVQYDHATRTMLVLYMNLRVWKRVINFQTMVVSESIQVPNYMSLDDRGTLLLTRHNSAYYIILRSTVDRKYYLVKLNDDGTSERITTILSPMPSCIFYQEDTLYRLDANVLSYFDAASSLWTELDIGFPAPFSPSLKQETVDIVLVVDSLNKKMLFVHDRSIHIDNYNITDYASVLENKQILGYWDPVISSPVPQYLPLDTSVTTMLQGRNLMFGTNFTYEVVLYASSMDKYTFPILLCNNLPCIKPLVSDHTITSSPYTKPMSMLYSARRKSGQLCSSNSITFYREKILGIAPTSVRYGSTITLDLSFIASDNEHNYYCKLYVPELNITSQVPATADLSKRTIACKTPNYDGMNTDAIYLSVVVSTNEYVHELENSRVFFVKYYQRNKVEFIDSMDSAESMDLFHLPDTPENNRPTIQFLSISESSPRTFLQLASNFGFTIPDDQRRKYLTASKSYMIENREAFIDFIIPSSVTINRGELIELSLVQQALTPINLVSRVTQVSGTSHKFSLAINLSKETIYRELDISFDKEVEYRIHLGINNATNPWTRQQYWRIYSKLLNTETDVLHSLEYDVEMGNMDEVIDIVSRDAFKIEIGYTGSSTGSMELLIDRLGLSILSPLNVTMNRPAKAGLSDSMKLVVIIVPTIGGVILLAVIVAIIVTATVLIVMWKRSQESQEKFSWERDINSHHNTLSGRFYRTYQPTQLKRRIDYVSTLHRNSPTSLTDIITMDESFNHTATSSFATDMSTVNPGTDPTPLVKL